MIRIFWDSIIEPILSRHRPKTIVEVGSAKGENTKRLLDFCRVEGCTLHAIDPAPQFEVADWIDEFGDLFVFHRALSVDVLPRIKAMDAVLIDGDHNWYTVYRELSLIEERSQRDVRMFPLVFLHDIGWPFGRRDAYYDPDTIPIEHRHPFSRGGMVPGQSPLQTTGGFRAKFHVATYEHGARNGVLTAVEDFLEGREAELEFAQVPGFHGLGIIVPVALPAGEDSVRSVVHRIGNEPHLVPLIESLEASRLDYAVKVSKLRQRVQRDRLRGTAQEIQRPQASRRRDQRDGRRRPDADTLQ